MLTEIPPEEFAAALDACTADLLWEAGIGGPPIDAAFVAERLGLVVIRDDTMPHRARFVRLTDRSRPFASGVAQPSQGTIVVGPAERPERRQWAVAHEIGESVAYRLFDSLGIRPEVAPPESREQVANHLASCLLLPRRWFAADGRALDWDLFALKARYETASHELIARRMLEMEPPVVITLCDLGRITWRRSNATSRVPLLLSEERRLWQKTHRSGEATAAALDPSATGLSDVRCWPIHEPDWRREILRSQIEMW